MAIPCRGRMLVVLPATRDRKQRRKGNIMNTTPIPSYFKDIPIVAAGTTHLPFTRWRPVSVTHDLMSYEAAAKSIFVKANGLPAYYQTTGLPHKK
jgi:hypothetical protein